MRRSRLQLAALLLLWPGLAGGVRPHELELPKEACAKLRALAVEVHTEWAILHEWFAVPPGACDP